MLVFFREYEENISGHGRYMPGTLILRWQERAIDRVCRLTRR